MALQYDLLSAFNHLWFNLYFLGSNIAKQLLNKLNNLPNNELKDQTV
jgi:hypothetical protein